MGFASWLMAMLFLAGCSSAPRAPVQTGSRAPAPAVPAVRPPPAQAGVRPPAPSLPDPQAVVPSVVPSIPAAPVVNARPAVSPPEEQKDGPGDRVPPGPDQLPDGVPRVEPLHRWANRPYAVMGRQFVPRTSVIEHRERGVASWYGRKFHGRSTASGERYDMYALSAAHPTLPIPSYVRVTHVRSGRSVVVRVNDRGPFAGDRVIDLSFTAAHRLGIVDAGTAEVEIELVASPSGFAANTNRRPPAAFVGATTPPTIEPTLPTDLVTAPTAVSVPTEASARADAEATTDPTSIESILADRLEAPAGGAADGPAVGGSRP